MPQHAHTRKYNVVDGRISADGKRTFDTLAELVKHRENSPRPSWMPKLPASSHDADVATGSAVNVDPVACKEEDADVATGSSVNVDPVACKEESHEQESREQENSEPVWELYCSIKGSVDPPTSSHDADVATGFAANVEQTRKLGEYVDWDGTIFQTFAELQSYQQLNNRKSRISKLPVSSHDADVATGSTVNVNPRQTRKHPDGRTFLTFSELQQHNHRMGLKSKIPASSHVATGSDDKVDVQFGTIDWSTLRSLTSCLETEEDSLSTTSTVEYDYIEDQYPNKDEGHKGADAKYPTKEEVSAIIAKVQRRRGFSYPVSPKLCPENEWIASWKEVLQPRSWTWISVYAYFNNKQRNGGYGVILRSEHAKPITASAKYSKDAKSFFYQAFMGIKKGVELAEKNKRYFLNVECNSSKVPALFLDTRFCSSNKCRDKFICESCRSCISIYMGWDSRLVAPLLVELRGKKIAQMTSSFGTDAAGHYLAKWGKMVRKKEERNAPDDDKLAEMKPADFPQGLKHILWHEAFRKFYLRNAWPLVEDEIIW